MAILTGQNIGANQRGILNLGATINTPLDTTLRNVTDGLGNNSPLQLSTTQAAFAGFATAPAADIVWRTNPILTDYTGWHQTDGTFRILTKNNASLFINIANSILFSNGLSAQSIMSSNGALGLGIASTPSARLHVRGDGTNPVARLENSSGSAYFQVNSNGTATVLTGISTTGVEALRVLETGTITSTTGVYNGFNYAMLGSFRPPSGNPSFRPLSIAYELNASGANTGTATGIFLNATETALNGMAHNLIDLQVGGVSRFRLDNTGAVVANFMNIVNDIRLVGNIRIASTGDGILNLFNNLSNNFNRLNLGGTTNAFPAIKRNGAAIDFRLADDSAYCSIEAGGDSKFRGTLRVLDTAGNNAMIMYGDGLSGTRTLWVNGSVGVGVLGNNASARLQVDSTTQGFLPPRMTTAQINAIATPAEGLVVYNTTISHLCVYQAGAWVKLSHTPM